MGKTKKQKAEEKAFLKANPQYDPARRYRMSFSVSWSQREQIKELAKQCGETPSTYVQMRALNYTPHRCLDGTEKEFIDEMRAARREMQCYNAGLKVLDRQQRKEMFSHYSYMVGWNDRIIRLAQIVAEYLLAVGSNPKPTAAKMRPEAIEKREKSRMKNAIQKYGEADQTAVDNLLNSHDNGIGS